MSDVVNLSTVNLDILLEVVKHGLGVRDLLSLRAVRQAVLFAIPAALKAHHLRVS